MADLFLVPYVRAVWRMLEHRLGRSGRMCIFGAGEHTRWLLSVTEDLPRLPIECIIDDRPSDELIAGLAVRTPNTVDIEAIDLILISSDRWEDRLADRAGELWGDGLQLVLLYEGLPSGPYDKNDDRSEALQRVRSRATLQTRDKNVVVIVSDQPRSREAKLGYALQHAGLQPVLLHHRPATFDAAAHFQHTHRFRNEWEMLRMACEYAPMAYHVTVNTDYRLAAQLLRNRPGVIVVDSYDLIAGMYTEEYFAADPACAEEMDRERYCLESADGLCCRSRDEIDVLKERLGYKCSEHLLMFADGCWNNQVGVERSVGSSLHVAYAGKVVPKPLTGDRFAFEGQRLTLAKTLAGHEIHFHLYPSFDRSATAFETAFSEYRDLERDSAYFHLHRPVPADRIAEELSRHDAAIFIYNKYAFGSDAPLPWTDTKLRLATTNKFYDYIDAGLPIIHNAAPGSWVDATIGHYGVGVNVRSDPPETWGNVFRGVDWDDLRGRARRARQECDIRRHVGELIEFYEGLHRERGQNRGNEVAAAGPKESLTHERANNRSDDRPALV